MNATKLENFKIEPDTLAALHARARRARSEFVHSLVVRLISKLTPRADLRPWRAHWG